MPQLLLLMAAGAGLYSAYRWVSREAEKAAAAADRARDELRRTTDPARAGPPKDLGALVWDDTAKAYRPKKGD